MVLVVWVYLVEAEIVAYQERSGDMQTNSPKISSFLPLSYDVNDVQQLALPNKSAKGAPWFENLSNVGAEIRPRALCWLEFLMSTFFLANCV